MQIATRQPIARKTKPLRLLSVSILYQNYIAHISNEDVTSIQYLQSFSILSHQNRFRESADHAFFAYEPRMITRATPSRSRNIIKTKNRPWVSIEWKIYAKKVEKSKNLH